MNKLLLTFSISLMLMSTHSNFAQTTTDCGSFRTQTQGGWGTNASGNNPGSYRDAHFDEAFPDGLVIGCDKTILFTSSAAVQEFLPSGSSPVALTESYIDPVSYSNVLAGQVLALSLSVGFDSADPTFSSSDILLSQLIISTGILQGSSVGDVLAIANAALGDCPTPYTTSQINSVVSSINQNYVDGYMDNGYLECPEEVTEEIYCELSIENLETQCELSDSLYTLTVTLNGANGSFTILSEEAVQGNGQEICFEQFEDSTTSSTVSVVLSFPLGVDHSLQIIQMDDPSCSAASSNQCGIGPFSAPAPDCCELQINCPDNDLSTLTCISEIPDPDPSSIEVLTSCGETMIEIEEMSVGSGCYNDPMSYLHIYTITSDNAQKTCIEEYRIVDSIAPVIECPPTLILDCFEGSIQPLDSATAMDNCDASPYIDYSDLPYSGCNGFNRMWTATDECGNIAVCYQEVLFQDTTAPIIAVPNDMQIECGASTDPIWTGQASATDQCSEVSISFDDDIEQTESCTATITRTWTAMDQCGNSSVGHQLIGLVDLSGPVIHNVPPSSQVQCGEAPEPADAFAVDACSGDTLIVNTSETSTESGCRTTIEHTYTAIDSCGNATSLIRNYVIEDTQGPEMTCPSDVYLNCGDLELGPEYTGYPEANDNCSGTVITINYQDSELDMNSCPPVIIRQWTAVDTCGNSSNCIQRIFFSDTVPPSVECLDDAVVDCSLGETTDPVFTGIPTATDDCSDITITYNDGSVDGNCPLTFTRTWVIRDACFNYSFCQQSITIIDNQAPSIICSDVSISCAYSTALPTITGEPEVEDCLDVQLSYSDSSPFGQCPVRFIRTWLATDQCGNSSSCQQTISLNDNMIPVIFCPSDTTISCESDLSPEVLGYATALDFCSEVSVGYSDVETNDECQSIIQRNWMATDACGNSRTCTQTITLGDGGILTWVCPADTVVECQAVPDPIVSGYPEAESICATISYAYNDSIITTSSGGTDETCMGLRTQTQGGWGTSASGNNPGSYRDAHFDEAFPQGITIGCDEYILFTSSHAVQEFLPSGSTPRVLENSLVDPIDYSNVLAGQILALSLSIGFDLNDPDFGESSFTLGEMIISNGAFEGYAVQEILDLANEVLGGCRSDVSTNEINAIVSQINENYVDGAMNNGLLVCPGDPGSNDSCTIIYRTWSIISACSDTIFCQQTITTTPIEPTPFSIPNSSLYAYPSPTSGSVSLKIPAENRAGDMIQLLDRTGEILKEFQYDGTTGSISIDLGQYVSGVYLIRWLGGSYQSTVQVIKE